MGDGTSIGWTDATWNPIRGCRRTAPEGSKQSGCGDTTGGGCYAERQAARFCGPGQAYEGLVKITASGPRWTGKVKFVNDHLMDPFRWTRPRRIFTDSMSDMFYEGVTDPMRDRIVAVMMICAHHETRGGHIFQTLTKRPKNMRRYFEDPATRERVARQAGTMMEDGDAFFDVIMEQGLVHSSMWWGTSIENQWAIDERLIDLLATPAACRFLSIEPMLGPVAIGTLGTLPGDEFPGYELVANRLHWVIVGCESGPGARPCDVQWIRDVRDECATGDVAFFLKQATPLKGVVEDREGSWTKGTNAHPLIELPYLDGIQHVAFPDVHGLQFSGSRTKPTEDGAA